MASSDRWSRWLLADRDAGDQAQRDVSERFLHTVANRVLAGAGALEGKTLLDIGTGDGLIGRAALPAVGSRGLVVFSDVSEPLLDSARARVAAAGFADRARFVVASAEALAPIADRSVDAVTTRSVLLFVSKKDAALSEMFRVLRPGGRISLYEPVNRLMFPEPADRFFGYDITDVTDLGERVKATLAELEDPAAASMGDYDDRDLLELVGAAGFASIHLECHVDIETDPARGAVSLRALLDGSPNPLAPRLGEVIERALDAGQRERFVGRLAAAIEQGAFRQRRVAVYLVAHRPGEPPTSI